jgi:hypothetical protein
MDLTHYSLIATLALFTIYTVWCAWHEKFIPSIRDILGRAWGRQVVFDLYLGLLIFAGFIFMTEPSFLLALLWTGGLLVFGNIASLLYLVVNFEQIFIYFAQ